MKIRLTLPWGGTFEYERERRAPLSDGHFYAICCIIGGAIFMTPFVLMILY